MSMHDFRRVDGTRGARDKRPAASLAHILTLGYRMNTIVQVDMHGSRRDARHDFSAVRRRRGTSSRAGRAHTTVVRIRQGQQSSLPFLGHSSPRILSGWGSAIGMARRRISKMFRRVARRKEA